MKRIQRKKPVSSTFWFDSVLAFANAKEPAAGLPSMGVFFSDSPERAWQLAPPETWSPESLPAEQAALRKLLAALVKKKGATRSVSTQITKAALKGAPFMPLVKGGVMVWNEPLSGYKVLAEIVPRNLTQWYGFALRELVTQGFGESVRVCALRTCGKYFVDSATKGRDAHYCSRNHASQDRVAASRKGMSVEAWRNRR